MAVKKIKSAKVVPTKRVWDFTDVKEPSLFSPKRKKAGDYEAVVKSFETGISKAGNEQWIFALQLTSDASAVYGFYCSFEDKQAWKLRNLVVACGMKAPKKKVAIDGAKLVGKTLGIELDDDEYEGREKSNIVRVFPASELEDAEPVEEDDDEEEEDDEVDTDSDDEDDDDEEETDEDEDDSDEEDDSDDEEEDDSDEEEDEEEDEESEPAPVKKKVKGGKKTDTVPAKKVVAKKGKATPEKVTKVAVKKTAKKRKSIDIDDL